MSGKVKFKDLYMETHIDHARKRKVSVPVYQFKITNNNKYNGDGTKKVLQVLPPVLPKLLQNNAIQ